MEGCAGRRGERYRFLETEEEDPMDARGESVLISSASGSR